jgi:PleD family two-component response regulator
MSIGITYNTPGMSVEELLRNADRAMYSAKDHGKNRYEAFEGQETIDTATGSRR